MATIRQAELSDREEIFRLASSFATSFVVDREAFNSSFPALLQSENAPLLVAVDAQRIVAYLLGFDHLTLFANGKAARVEEIMVDDEFRRHGIGRQLMDYFESWAKKRRCKLVALATRRAADFYRALGYQDSAIYFRKLL